MHNAHAPVDKHKTNLIRTNIDMTLLVVNVNNALEISFFRIKYLWLWICMLFIIFYSSLLMSLCVANNIFWQEARMKLDFLVPEFVQQEKGNKTRTHNSDEFNKSEYVVVRVFMVKINYQLLT